MISAPDVTEPLDAIRRKIDAIDSELLALVAARFALVDEVRAAKTAMGETEPASPLRPAREAAILRRILEADAPQVPGDVRILLWRALISEAVRRQAPVRIHVSGQACQTGPLRAMVAHMFGTMPVLEGGDSRTILQAVAANPLDIGIVATQEPWIVPFVEGSGGAVSVVGVLPLVGRGDVPKLLVFGHVPAVPSGHDETILVTDGQLPRDFAPAPLWSLALGHQHVTALPGFLNEHQMPLLGLARANDRLRLLVIGRYPSPMEIDP